MMLVQHSHAESHAPVLESVACVGSFASVETKPAGNAEPDLPNDGGARRELLQLALVNVGRIVPMHVVTLGMVVVLGLAQNLWVPSLLTGAMGGVVCVWRWMLANRCESGEALLGRDVPRIESQLQFQSALSGCMWVVATVAIYPNLPLLGQQIYVILAAGSLLNAAFFLSLVSGSFEMLAVPMVAALAGVHVFDDALRSVPLAGMIVLFAWTMFRGMAAGRATTILAIQGRFAADAAVDSLRLARDAAQAANVAKSQFLATMSHEIRTPMNGVLGSLELLRASELDQRQRQLLRSAATSTQALMEILNDVLDHAKIEAGKLQIAQAPMSTHGLLGAVASVFRSNAERKRLALVLDIDPGAADRVWGDPQRLKQVLLNLVSNAVNFTDRGSVTLRLRPAPTAAADHAGLLFEVVDTGIGMSAQALPSLFEPFHQIPSGDLAHRGTGLGLAISQRIVAAMGGKIEVHSEPGRGSRFSFALEFRRDLDQRPALQPASPASSSRSSASRRFSGSVLVVEDDPINRLVASDMLRHLGLTVAEAGDGLDALQQMARQRFSLVLMDCSLPVLDGYTATVELRQREARQHSPRVPVIAITAHAFDRDAAAGREAGMDGFLSKPYTLDELVDLLAQWLPETLAVAEGQGVVASTR